MGCSGDWPARKRAALAVRMMRMEILGFEEKDETIWGIFIVATEPVRVCVRCDADNSE